MTQEIMIVFLFPLIAMSVDIGDLVHDKMDVKVVGIVVDRIYDLIFRRIVLYDPMCILVGQFWGHMLLLGEA